MNLSTKVLVARLRMRKNRDRPVCAEAASLIEQQTKRIELLEQALEEANSCRNAATEGLVTRTKLLRACAGALSVAEHYVEKARVPWSDYVVVADKKDVKDTLTQVGALLRQDYQSKV